MKKTILTVSCLSFVGFSSIFAVNPAQDLVNQVLAVAQTNEAANIVTRLVAKSAAEVYFKKPSKKESEFAKDTKKAFASIALEEYVPLKKDANVLTQHADLVVPTCVKSLYDSSQDLNINSSTPNLKSTAVGVLKKETGRGFLINKDFKELKNGEDLGFFLLDCSTEVLDDKNTTPNILKRKLDDSVDATEITKSILVNKILTPLAMAYVGDGIAADVSKNKNVTKAISGLLETYVVKTLMKAWIDKLISK